MSTGLTLEMAQAKYMKYLDAEEKILTGQSYKIKDRELERVPLEKIRDGIKYWENKCNELANGGRGAKLTRIVPLD